MWLSTIPAVAGEKVGFAAGWACRGKPWQRDWRQDRISLKALDLNKTGKRLVFTGENTTSSCLGRSTGNKYPTFLKCERPHLCSVHFLPVCLYSGAWSVNDPGYRTNIATGAMLGQPDLEGTSGTCYVLRKHLSAPHLPNFPNNIPLFLKRHPAPERISMSTKVSYCQDFALTKLLDQLISNFFKNWRNFLIQLGGKKPQTLNSIIVTNILKMFACIRWVMHSL